MINSDIQLTQAQERIGEIREKMLLVSKEYTGSKEKAFLLPLLNERDALLNQTNKYSDLIIMSLQEAVENIFQEPILIENIGELLTNLRISAGKSQTRFADELGWKQPNLSRFEGENYGSQTIGKISEYAKLLGVYLHVYPSMTERKEERHTSVFSSMDQMNIITSVFMAAIDRDVEVADTHEAKYSGYIATKGLLTNVST